MNILELNSLFHFPGKELVRQGHLRSGGGSHLGHHRRALPPAPVLPQSLRPVAPSIQHYNSSGNSSTTSSNSYYKPDASYIDQLVKRSASSVNAKNRAPIAKPVRRSKSTKNPRNSQNFVTSIQHGGSVTLVSLNGDSTGSNR